jgi:hypothetical protein
MTCHTGELCALPFGLVTSELQPKRFGQYLGKLGEELFAGIAFPRLM